MTSDSILAIRARRMDDKTKKLVVGVYILSQYNVAILEEDGQGYTISPEGAELAEYLIRTDEEYKTHADEVAERHRKYDVLH